MEKSSNASGLVREHFQEKASSFDALYDEDRLVQRTLRPGLHRRKALAVDVVRDYEEPRVLDVGCGSGRVGELILEAGASEWVGNDFSEPMLELAKERLDRFGDKVSLVHGDFLTTPIEGRFDVVLALGYFDYQGDAHLHVRRMHELCAEGGSVVASFPRWTWLWLKGPLRKVRYEVIDRCPIFDYTERELRLMLGGAGFSDVQLLSAHRAGYVVRAVC